MTEIKVAKSAGFCFGVARAAELIEKEAKALNPIYTIGELIHNKTYVEMLRKKGVFAVSVEEALALPAGSRVVIRTHGIPKSDTAALINAGMSVLDATCPYVKKIHSIVEAETADGSPLIIMGDAGHPEVLGIRSFAGGESKVFSSAAELEAFFCENKPECEAFLNGNAPIAVSQTTFSVKEWKKSQLFIKKVCTNAKTFDTICSVTEKRQEEALSLATESDLMIVVGGHHSSNTRKLMDIACSKCEAVHIERAEELRSIFTDKHRYLKIAITAGASTPFSIIQEVKEQMADITKTTGEAEELSFEEMLNQSFKTLHTGERVWGTVSVVTPTEIHVDLGTKHTGILVYDEITDDSGVNLEELFKVGDQIEVMPIKFSDSEGTVMLSKKRLDSSKNWASIVAAGEEKSVLTGTVKEVVKGGVVVSSSNVRVFIPASQTGVPKEESLDTLKGKTVSFKIIETDDQRKRAVGSIKLANKVMRKQAIDQFLATAEVGQKFKGTVRSVTSYGAFVNLGPVDGMVHITELSWGRIKPPAEVVKVGDQIDVYIKAINAETGRISLGYKTEENNPWNIFVSKYNVGDDVKVKVVSIMPFGAFAEIIPGVDGLIHNTQLASKPVSSAASVCAVGDELEVKIIAIDAEQKRISLSRKALLAPEEGDTFEIVEEANIGAEEAPAETDAE